MHIVAPVSTQCAVIDSAVTYGLAQQVVLSESSDSLDGTQQQISDTAQKLVPY